MKQVMNAYVQDITRDPRVLVVLGLLGAAIIGGVGYWGYSSYAQSRNERAQIAFEAQRALFEQQLQQQFAGAKETDKPASLTSDSSNWQMIANGFGQSYTAHRHATLAPLFLAFQAQALWHAGETQGAIETLQKSLTAMGTTYPFYYLYSVTLQLMRLAGDDAAKTLGLQELRSLAQQANNPYRALALYELWHHAWVFQDTQTEATAYAQLQDLGNDEPLAALAQAKKNFLA